MSEDDTDRRVSIGGDEIDPDDLAWNDVRKKPVVVQATPMPFSFEVETREGTMQGEKGDVLIRGIEGELYPCDASIFAETYELVGGNTGTDTDRDQERGRDE